MATFEERTNKLKDIREDRSSNVRRIFGSATVTNHFNATRAEPNAMLVKTISVIIFILIVLLGSLSSAQCAYCVRSGATGNGDGADWSNAFNALPATLERGATYYVAAGSYPAYTFDDPVNGTLYIAIKKATMDDHGTDTGWDNSFASGQAVFAYSLIFRTGYWIFDGVTGSGSDYTSYGFAVDKPTNCSVDNRHVMFGDSSGQVTNYIAFSHTSLIGCGSSYDSGQAAIIQGWSLSNGDHLTISHNYFEDFQTSVTFSNSSDYSTIEYNYFKNNWSSASHHGVHINLFFVDYNTIRYNYIGDCNGSGCIVTNGTVPGISINNTGIYGNVFNGCNGGTGVIGAASTQVIANTKVYNNTFLNHTNAWFYIAHAGYGASAIGNEAYNNLDFNGNPAITLNGGVVTHDYNAFFDATHTPAAEGHIETGVGNPFVNSTAGDFHLKTSTDSGYSLLSPYDKDPDGNARGDDGTWDCGAYEFVSGSDPSSKPSAPSDLHIISQ